MRRISQKFFLGLEILFTLISLMPSLLWFILNFYYAKYKNNRIRKKLLRKLNDQGLSEHLSREIVESILPEIKIPMGESFFNGRHFFRRQDK
ncbi:MAG: hypothetical protein QXS21_03120 [Thermoproteota archaeon]|nr:hypothetical protein [Candidatus Brockarchaeota archaeon]